MNHRVQNETKDIYRSVAKMFSRQVTTGKK